ncbi:MAG TPA: Arc family DNA-binding protein [Blastocatellia bacterium]|nr:Arc family DNA-binding protein [Blastocatellia bacterium]
MATLTIKNIPDDLYEQLKQSADAHRRSINSEVIVCLERSLRNHQRDADELLANIRKLRRKTTHHRLTDRLLSQAKGEGRL